MTLILALSLLAACGGNDTPDTPPANTGDSGNTGSGGSDAGSSSGGGQTDTGSSGGQTDTSSGGGFVDGPGGIKVPMPNEPYRVVFTMFNGLNPVAREIEMGFIAVSEATGIDLWVMDNELDPIKMNSNVDMAITAGVDFYVLYTNDQESNPQLMDKLVGAGIPAGTIGTAAIATTGEEAPFLQLPNYDLGFLGAASAMQVAKDKGWTEDQIVFFSMGFLEAGGPFITRTQGAEAGARSIFPGVDYHETSSTGSAEVAFQRTADFLMTLPAGKKLVGWTHSDDVTASLLAAIRQAGREDDALLVSGGFTASMAGMLREPGTIIVGSIDLSFQAWGWDMMQHIIAYLNDGTPMPAIIPAPMKLLTPANINDFYPE